MNNLLQRFGAGRLITMAVISVALMAFFSYIMVRANQPDMALLFSQIEPAEGGRIIERLKAMSVPFEVKGDGTQIYAHANDVASLRMQLANDGMPSGGGVGYEIFDKQDVMGTTNAMLSINQMRALEGELGKSIRTIQGIQAARVHLVVPKRELFSEAKQEPSASVMVRMKGASVLSATQVQSIRYLVTAAVPGLVLDQVAIVDDRGNLLARGKDSNEAKDSLTIQQASQREYEQRVARSVEALLDRTLGLNKTRAEVTVDMDFDQVSSTSISYDPDGQVVKNQTTNEEGVTAHETSSATDSVSIQNALPVNPDAAAAGSQNHNQTSNTEENVNYEISNTTKTFVKEVGAIKRLSVAVMVDGTYKKKADGTQDYQALPEEEITKLKELVKTATGYKEDRGDVISLVNLKFSELPSIPDEQAKPFFGLNMNRLIELGVTALVVLIGLMTVIKPVITTLIRGVPKAPLVIEKLAPPPVVVAPPEEDLIEAPKLAASKINVDQIESMVQQSSIKKIAELVDLHPQEAVSIIRTWMYSDK